MTPGVTRLGFWENSCARRKTPGREALQAVNRVRSSAEPSTPAIDWAASSNAINPFSLRLAACIKPVPSAEGPPRSPPWLSQKSSFFNRRIFMFMFMVMLFILMFISCLYIELTAHHHLAGSLVPLEEETEHAQPGADRNRTRGCGLFSTKSTSFSTKSIRFSRKSISFSMKFIIFQSMKTIIFGISTNISLKSPVPQRLPTHRHRLDL